MSKYQRIDKIDGIYIFQSYEKPLRTKIYALEKENEVLRKALELACEKWNSNPYFFGDYYEEDFIRFAKEELKDENIGRDNRTEL